MNHSPSEWFSGYKKPKEDEPMPDFDPLTYCYASRRSVVYAKNIITVRAGA